MKGTRLAKVWEWGLTEHEVAAMFVSLEPQIFCLSLDHGDNFSAGVDPSVCSRESTGVVHLVRDILVGVS